ncbi:uncharacterized protein F4807DRAFT_295448 [Annulohypoxylon truncatum]|uniref:uncharacterized protein n=1 Tax=Annulohypoxylon truncatum TaxID=327061 RepID=UPI002007FBC8|nr:uncharacterized protein F4807DRAFT_295448 [Annulohypoxylon truncatum]KAI1205081.1 hypothetical protein F4807DRAFT_295448 [Annulohypoxylon truncatum]
MAIPCAPVPCLRFPCLIPQIIFDSHRAVIHNPSTPSSSKLEITTSFPQLYYCYANIVDSAIYATDSTRELKQLPPLLRRHKAQPYTTPIYREANYFACPTKVETSKKMYSPYGSYSSMSSASQPMDIPTSSYLSYNYNGSYSSRCAFPSWPQRSSLTDEHDQQRATSYLSDDDLFPCDDSDDAHSVSSAGSTTPTSPVAAATEADMLRMQREQMAMQREAIKFLLGEKERRKQQQQLQQASKKQRRSSSGSKRSSPKTKQAHLDAIAEAGE